MNKSKPRIFCNYETTFTGRQRLGLFNFFVVLEDDKKKSIVSAKQIFEPFLMVDNILFWNRVLCRSRVNKKYQNVFFFVLVFENKVWFQVDTWIGWFSKKKRGKESKGKLKKDKKFNQNYCLLKHILSHYWLYKRFMLSKWNKFSCVSKRVANRPACSKLIK